MKIYEIIRLLSLFSLIIVFGACEEEGNMVIEEPVYTYSGADFSANAITENAVRTALSNLTLEMKKGRTAGTVVDLSSLTQLYTTGDPALAAVTSTYYADRIEGATAWLGELAKASGGTYSPGTPSGEGGVYGGHLFDEHGLELEQLVEKGLFAAAMYNHAATLLAGNLDATTADRIVAIFGAHPDFSNSDNGSLANPDQFSAKYTARRDKNDGTGMYSQMQAAIAKLQTAIAAGDDLQREEEQAVNAIKTTWEKALFATVINYCHAAISKLSTTNPTDADKASALHSYSEAVGFTHGWRQLPQEYKMITDAQIDELLELLNAPHDDAPTSYTFATDPVNELPKLTQAISKIQNIYGFSDQEIQDFRENWVSEQGR